MRLNLATGLLLVPMTLTAAAATSTPANDASALTQVRPVSTGVTGPRILYSPSIEIRSTELAAGTPSIADVVLKLNLDEKGQAQGVQVLKSLNPAVDARVVSAVHQFKFSPAKLDDKVIPFNLNLVVEVKH